MPTAATSASAIKCQYPQNIFFSWPDKDNNDFLTGGSFKESSLKEYSYLSILKTVFDEQLERLGKAVVDTTDPGNVEAVITCGVTLNPVKKTGLNTK